MSESQTNDVGDLPVLPGNAGSNQLLLKGSSFKVNWRQDARRNLLWSKCSFVKRGQCLAGSMPELSASQC